MNNIREIVTTKTAAIEDVIDRLRHVLAQAERGEVVGVGIAYTYEDGAIGTTYSSTTNHGVLAGAMATLQFRYLKAHNED